MIIGIPTEIKDSERRVALTPSGATTLAEAGHTVLVQAGAGTGSGFDDADYVASGARIVESPQHVWTSPLIVKVKEPLPVEYELMHEKQIVFTYLHLAAEPQLTRELLARRVTGIAYETIEDVNGELPLLTPMSEIAGRMAPQVIAWALTHLQGGRGVLLGGVPGVEPSHVVILGAGVVGSQATRIAVGMGARVTVFNRSIEPLRRLDAAFGGRVGTLAADLPTIAEVVRTADAVVGAALTTGARAPILVSEDLVTRMRPGAVIVDVAVDQGGCVATTRPTSHSNPTYVMHEVVHYAVPNMPGAVPRTATFALCNATLPYVRRLAEGDLAKAASESPAFAAGINTHRGVITHKTVADALGLEFTPLGSVLGQ